MPVFRVIDLVRDGELLEAAHGDAAEWLESAAPTPDALGSILATWSTRFKLIEVG
jgi:hypothetical protein